MKANVRFFELFRTLLAVGIALLCAAIVILLTSDEPGTALKLFLIGPWGSLRHFSNVLELTIPLIFTGLAVTIMFTAAQFNLGVEGAFFIGAVGACFVAAGVTLPAFIHPAAAILFGGFIGAVFCGIPGILKVKWGSSELVSSLMFNYIAYFFGLYIINYVIRDINAGAMVSLPLAESAKLARLIPKTKIHSGIFLAAAAVVLTALFLYRTRWGYRIRVIGENPRFAQYAGISTVRAIMASQLIGGFLAGAGGSIELLGLYRRFSWQVLPGYGWTGIIVAILARNNPVYVPIAAFFLAYMRIGADIMSRTTDVPNEFVAVIQGIMIILIAADSFLARYRHKIVVQEAMG